MHCTVDPTTTLREQDLPVIGGNSVGVGITNELGLEHGEVLQEEGGKVSIFTKVQQVLHVESVDTVFGVVGNKLVRDEEWLVGVRRAQAVESETTGQAGDGSKERLEGLGHVMGQEVLVHLHHGDDRLLRVRKLCFTANTQQLLVVDHAT